MTNYRINYITKTKLKVEVFLNTKQIPCVHTMHSFTQCSMHRLAHTTQSFIIIHNQNSST